LSEASTCLAFEARDPLRIVGEGVRQDLQRDIATPGVAGAIDLTHATSADGRDELVDAEARAGGNGYVSDRANVGIIATNFEGRRRVAERIRI
jgi:hypothetical protein